MLRRKLLTRIGLLMAAFVAGAFVAISLLQSALTEIDRTNADASVLVGGVQTVGSAVAAIQAARAGINPADTTEHAGALTRALAGIEAHAAVRAPDGPAHRHYEALRSALPPFLETAPPGSPFSVESLATTVRVQSAVQELGVALRTYVGAEQLALGRRFRALVITLTLAALVMVNVAVFVLLRAAQVVLRPVGALVEGSRQLAAERFEHRVVVDQQDEFGELAHAYNRLAAELQSSEERKAEALRQLAVTLNHDLNNAMTVIEMQLGLMDRQSGSNPALAGQLREIRSSLRRMSGTVGSLKNIRRVVLTEYGPGQKMVDLERSVAPPPEPPASAPRGHAA